ncbi:GIY-YIG nuclease family protein [Halocola ammonii]
MWWSRRFITIVKTGYVYITSNRNRTTLYVGVTSNIKKRVFQHKFAKGSKFTSKYNCCDLLYLETIPGMMNAINREKQLKRWHRDWKWNLIKEGNPELRDLSEGWFGDSG